MRIPSAFVQTAALVLLIAPAATAQCTDGAPIGSCAPRRTVRAIDNDMIAIAPFRTSGAEKSLAYLSYGLVDFLAAELSGDVGPRAVEPGETQRAWERAKLGAEPATDAAAARVARQLGAGQVVFGSVIGRSDQITIIASILNSANGTPRGPPLKVVGSADSLSVLVADLSSKILGRSSGALRMTGSLPDRVKTETMREFVAARDAYRHGAHAEAFEKFSAVLALDSSFVAAAYWMTVLTEMEAGGRAAPAVQRIAWENRGRLGRDERDLLEASIGVNGSAVTASRNAIRLATQAVAERTNAPEAWAILGETYLHYGALLGLDDWLQRARAAFERGYSSDSTVGIGHMGYVTYLLNDVRAHKVWSERLARRSRNPGAIATEQFLSSLMSGTPAAVRAAGEKLARAEPAAFGFAVTTIPSAEVAAERDRVVSSAACCERTAEEAERHRRVALGWNVHLATNGGRAGRTAARLKQFDGDTARQLMDALQGADESDAELEQFARLVAAKPTVLGQNAEWLMRCEIALARLRRADTTGLGATLALLQREQSNEARTCSIVAGAIAASKQPGASNAELLVADSVMRFKIWHTPSGNMNPHWNYDLALAFAQRGEYRLAASAARRRLTARRIRLAVSLRDEGRWFLMAGDTSHAIPAFQTYLRLRDNPEPALIAERDAIRAQLSAITPHPKRAKGTR